MKSVVPVCLVALVMGMSSARAATYYLSTSGNDANPCSQTQRCMSFDRAYQIAGPGDTVLIASGTYSAQSIVSTNSKLTAADSLTPHPTLDVTFKPESGVVTIGDLNLGRAANTPVKHLAFEDIVINGGTSIQRNPDNGSHCIHFTRTKHRGTVYIGDSDHHVSMQFTEVGPWQALTDSSNADGIDLYNSNTFLFEDSTLHNIYAQQGVGLHPDGIATCGSFECGGRPSVHDVTIRRSRFWMASCIDFRGQRDDYNMVLENNIFGAPDPNFSCGYTAQIAGAGTIVRYNTFEGDIQNAGSGNGNNQQWYGNILMAGLGCPNGDSSGVLAEYNVWNSDRPATCNGGANNSQLTSFSGYFVSLNPQAANGSDLHLTANAKVAIDKVPTSYKSFPSTDIFGNSRPFGNGVDAGANEFGASQSSGIQPPAGLTALVQ